jgi:hypothetical protein
MTSDRKPSTSLIAIPDLYLHVRSRDAAAASPTSGSLSRATAAATLGALLRPGG